jgi:hypothetical protein
VDDILDYESASATLGKPGGADLNLGLATGPALYAWEEHPEMGELIQRKFEQPGDVEQVRCFPLLSDNSNLIFLFDHRRGITSSVLQASSVRGRWHRHTPIRLKRCFKNSQRARQRLDWRR